MRPRPFVAPIRGRWSITRTCPSPRACDDREVILVRCTDDPGVRAWVNVCPHEYQRLDRGRGAAMREGQIICPKHGSMFDTCSGYCDNGDAADTTLVDVDIAVDEADGTVSLDDPHYDFAYDGPIDDGDDDSGGPSSSSHLQL